jgi:tight adherence protein B
MELIVIGVGIFVSAIIIIELLRFAFRNMNTVQRAQIRKRLRRFIYLEKGRDGTEIYKKRLFSDISWLNTILDGVPFVARVDRLIIQANARYPVGFYLLLSLVLACLGFYAVFITTPHALYAMIAAVIAFFIPYVYLSRKKAVRLEKFKTQLPDALDLLARSLKAGQSFNGGLSMAAEEMDDPIGPEFSDTLNEINYGVSVSEALKNLAGRIDCEELRFFIIGVVLQRETGGNLAEMMEMLANLIRERYKFKGKVRTLTAEARLSMWVLISLPILLGVFLYIRNPNFIRPLLEEPIGKLMILSAGVGMIVGAVVMLRMVDVKV